MKESISICSTKTIRTKWSPEIGRKPYSKNSKLESSRQFLSRLLWTRIQRRLSKQVALWWANFTQDQWVPELRQDIRQPQEVETSDSNTASVRLRTNELQRRQRLVIVVSPKHQTLRQLVVSSHRRTMTLKAPHLRRWSAKRNDTGVRLQTRRREKRTRKVTCRSISVWRRKWSPRHDTPRRWNRMKISFSTSIPRAHSSSQRLPIC